MASWMNKPEAARQLAARRREREKFGVLERDWSRISWRLSSASSTFLAVRETLASPRASAPLPHAAGTAQ